MAEHWISAATARDIVAQPPDSAIGTYALCNRSFAALVKTKARLFTIKKQGLRLENAEVPAAFWWAGGHEALEQDWATGDFSTWIKREEEWQAFGVSFALSGVLEMLPTERRADVTRRLSVAGRAEWVSAAEASLLACRLPGVINGRKYIVEQARLELLQGQAVLAERFTGRDCTTRTWDEREWPIPTLVWDGIEQATNVHQQWDLGRLIAGVAVDGKPHWLRLSGVHILAKPLRGALSITAPPAPEPTSRPTAGGRLPAEWWDDMWCAMCSQVFEGKLIPNSQAEIEKAMLQWAQDHGHEPSVSTVRPKARKLFAVLKP